MQVCNVWLHVFSVRGSQCFKAFLRFFFLFYASQETLRRFVLQGFCSACSQGWLKGCFAIFLRAWSKVCLQGASLAQGASAAACVVDGGGGGGAVGGVIVVGAADVFRCCCCCSLSMLSLFLSLLLLFCFAVPWFRCVLGVAVCVRTMSLQCGRGRVLLDPEKFCLTGSSGDVSTGGARM